ncbi:nitroreductase [Castellaniella sp.]|uniref:nitroreductase n=1 Tax=Castellaniella sp. TaxID=1955812 RepID=UPI003561801C
MDTTTHITEPCMPASEAIRSRRSIRAFLPNPVPQCTIEQILETAARAPSGSNIQPWQVVVLTGSARQALSQEIEAAALSGDAGEAEYAYYPRQWREPYLARRRTVGWALYGSLGIQRGQSDRMAAQHRRNYCFFDAPVGLFLTMDRDMEQGSWLDLGMFAQNIMIAARGLGLDTCPQAAFCRYHRLISQRLGIPAHRQLIMAIALGYADMTAPENNFPTEREPVHEFTRFVDELP